MHKKIFQGIVFSFILFFPVSLFAGFEGQCTDEVINPVITVQEEPHVLVWTNGLRLTATPLAYDAGLNKWKYKIEWKKNGNTGSLLIHNSVYVAQTASAGTVETGFTLSPNKKYFLLFYSKNHLYGNILANVSFTTEFVPPDPADPNSIFLPGCAVQTYQDTYYNPGAEKYCLDQTTLQGVYFVAKNQVTGFQPYWKDSMTFIFSEVEKFFETQFQNKMDIAVAEPILVYGDYAIEDYDQYTMEMEIRKKVPLDTLNSFVSLMMYPVQGENGKYLQGDAWGATFVGAYIKKSSSAANNWFWLDPNQIDDGAVFSAHEFGHTLGIPHPFEEEENKTCMGDMIDPNYSNLEKGSVMSYGGQIGPLNPHAFLTKKVKTKMMGL